MFDKCQDPNCPDCYGGPGYKGIGIEEIDMSLIEDLGIDPEVDENSFTKEDAAKVFEKAAEACKSGETMSAIMDALLKAGLGVLKILA